MRAVEGNVETLLRENAQLRQENAELATKLSWQSAWTFSHEQIAWFKQRFFSRSSEALSEKDKRQLRLFDEAESSEPQADQAENPQERDSRRRAHTQCRPSGGPFPKLFPVMRS